MSEYNYKGDPLEGTKWEYLTIGEYYCFLSDEEKQEFREYLESINAPLGVEINYKSDSEENYKTWRDIVSMSEEELKDYWNSVKARYTIVPIQEIGRNPLEGTPWENLTIYDYIMKMSDVDRKELFNYLDRIQAPFSIDKGDGIERWSWRDITTTALEVVYERFNIPGAYVYNKELGLYESVNYYDSDEIPL